MTFFALVWVQCEHINSDQNQYIVMDEINPEIWNEIGLQAFLAGRYKEAATFYKCAYNSNINNVEVFVHLGYSYLYLNDYDSAIELFEKGHNLYPKSLQVLMGLGTGFRGKEQYGMALKCFRNAAVLEPNNPEPYTEIALMYWQTGSPELANDAITAARELNPDDPFIDLALGDAEFLKHNYQAAERYYRRAVLTNQASPDAQYKLGRVMLELKDYEASLKAFELALAKRPEWPSIFYYVGRVERVMGNNQKAISAFERSLQLDPSNISASALLHRLLLRSFRFREAWNNFQRFVEHTITTRPRS